jgi:glycosyltransferase involved in cell wall biosynthesis
MVKILNKRVAIIHPWLPQYRLAFFELLHKQLLSKGIEMSLYFGTPEASWASRGDTVETPIGIKLPTREIKILGRSLLVKDISELKRRKYDLVIVEQAIRNLETYSLLFGKTPVAFWGHGKTYTQPTLWLLEKLKFIITKQGKWFFSYTNGGKNHLVQQGFNPEKITVLNNTFDTNQLAIELSETTDSLVTDFQSAHKLDPKKTALYIGALDVSKRLDLLLAAGDLVFAKEPSFRLLIIGAGPEKDRLTEVVKTRSWATMLDPRFGMDKAVVLKASSVLCAPGRVGLVAIDSFVASLPIVTTPDPFHPPEFEYLESGYNSVVSSNLTAESYSEAILEALSAENNFRLREACLESSKLYTLNNMVDQFVKGVELAIQDSSEVKN